MKSTMKAPKTKIELFYTFQAGNSSKLYVSLRKVKSTRTRIKQEKYKSSHNSYEHIECHCTAKGKITAKKHA